MFSLQEVCQIIKARLVNDPFQGALLHSAQWSALSPLDLAGQHDITFFFSKHYLEDFLKTKAGVVVVGNTFVSEIMKANPPLLKHAILITCDDPYLGMAQLTEAFSKKLNHIENHSSVETSDVHPTAVIAPDVVLPKNIKVGAYVVIESKVQLGEGVILYPRVTLGRNCKIGNRSILFTGVTLYSHVHVGEDARIHAGAVIGADGFGYCTVKDQATGIPTHHKIFHLGGVKIGNRVEIGANTTIDRGTLGDTVIGDDVKIDNQVQVGHNCKIGPGTLVCGAAGLAGSSSTGKYVVLGAGSGIGNQVHVGDFSRVGGFTGVTKDIGPHQDVMGMPAKPADEYARMLAFQNRAFRKFEKERKKS